MGYYNPQYKNYYESIKNKRKSFNYNTYDRNNKIKKEQTNFFTKRIIRDLIGAFCLFTFILLCKVMPTSQAKKMYKYSKQIVNKNYTAEEIISKVKKVDYKDNKTINYIKDAFKKMQSEEVIKGNVQDKFSVPCVGEITSSYGKRKDPITKKEKFHKGVDISVKENTDIKACGKGTVKVCENDKELGKYIMIDHGKGIETRYAHLNDILVKKGEKVNNDTIIGKSGSTGKSTGPHLHFELIYMGNAVDPEEFLWFHK